MKAAVVLGTRPEIIKMSPVVRALKKKKVDFFIIHTGQHYSYNMDKVFFEDLELPPALYNLEVGSGSHSAQTAKILEKIEQVYLKEKPDVVLVEGDTTTVLAGALAAVKLNILVGHVEAGLRSYDRTMPEETNRILTDHMSSFLFPPTKKAEEILINEGIDKNKIFVTGNTIVDAVQQNLSLAEKKNSVLKKLGFEKKEYCLLTVHRQENADVKQRLESIFWAIAEIPEKFIYPIHPRTKKMIEQFKIRIPKNVKVIEPLGFLDFLMLEANAKIILTDSGGVQEEACILKVPCVTLRDNTERSETLEVGSNILAGTNKNKILECYKTMLKKKKDWKNPFGDGNAGEKIVDAIIKYKSVKSKN